jgi:8-oxo-dGTP diphosphatase
VGETKRRGKHSSEPRGPDVHDDTDFDLLAVAVDLVIFTVSERDLRILLVRRSEPPFKGRWALPGGFVRTDESLEAAARRKLEEETGVRDVYLEQLYTFGDPGRDPRSRVITVAYFALISSASRPLGATADSHVVAWKSAFTHTKLAFDNSKIL